MTHPTDALRLVPILKSWCEGGLLQSYEQVAERLLSELAAAPASPLPGGGWQDISTAPKDGTVIDVWRDDGGRDTVFWGMPHHDCGEMGKYCDSDWHRIRAPGWVCNTFHEFVGRNHNPFTHWMPVPAAPTGDAE